MNKINVKLCEITTRVIAIGFEGENNHTQVAFDCSPVFADYPNAVASLAVRPPVGSIYPKSVTKSGNDVLWDVSASDCANDGSGEYQLTFTNGEEIIKTWTGNMRVYASLLTNGNPPTPIEDWLEAANAVLGALEDMTASASGLPAGSDPTAEMTEVGGHKNIALGIPAGAQGVPGQDGQDGQDGVSPVITVTDITGGHRLTIVDAQGTHTVDVMNGTQGATGADGYSPTVAITDITGGHTVTITDKNGAHAFNVMDGTPGFSPVATVTKSGHTATISITDQQGTTTAQVSDGNPAELIDDTAPAADKTFSSDKLNTELSGLMSAIANLKSVEYSERTDILGYSDISFANATDGMLQSNGTVSGSTGYCVSDYLPLAGVKKMFRHNINSGYNFEAYALYDSAKNMIAGTYHARTTSYTMTTYLNYNYVLFYDITATGAAYIRITKDKSLSYLFTQEYVTGYNYSIDGDIMASNIQATEESVAGLVDLTSKLNEKKLAAKSFILFRSDRNTVFDHTYINYSNGNILTGTGSTYSDYRTSDYIEVEAQKQYASGNGYSYACYDENKALLPNAYGRLFSSDISLRGTGRYWFITTPENCKYIRICDAGNTSGGVCGLQKVPEEYDIVNLGDSIFGVNPACFDISSIAQEKTGFNFANSGFGGSQASTYPDSTSPYYSFNLWKLADAIYDEDFTEQDASAEAIQESDGSILYVPRLTILKSVDFTKIRLLTIAYGANDASKNTVLDNENDKYDKTTYCGALRYSIEKIYSKYPKINIALMSPLYGRKGSNNEMSTDTWTNSLGLHVTDYVDAMKEVAEEYHLPFFNHYMDMGVNDYNWQTYLRDGSHLSYIYGANLFGARVGQEVTGLLADYA